MPQAGAATKPTGQVLPIGHFDGPHPFFDAAGALLG